MKIIFTGQSGLEKKQYIKSVAKSCEEKFQLKPEIFSVGELMLRENRDTKLDINKILDLPIAQLTCLRRSVFKDILRLTTTPDGLYFIDMHAVFRWRWGLFSSIDFDQIYELDPDVFITIIDDVDFIYYRLKERKKWSQMTLQDIMVWREEEILTTRLICETLNMMNHQLRGGKKAEHYLIARGSSPEMIGRLVMNKSQKKVYVSFPITGLNSAKKQEVDDFRRKVADNFIAFDPYKMKERGLIKEIGLATDNIKSVIGTHDKEINTIQSTLKSLSENDKILPKLSIPEKDEIVKGIASSCEVILKPNIDNREDGVESTDFKNQSFAVHELKKIEKLIDDQIILRDFYLIDQSDFIIVYIGTDSNNGNPVISAGCQTEIKYATDKAKEVYVICERKDRLSPWVNEHATDVYTSVDETFKALVDKGYLGK